MLLGFGGLGDAGYRQRQKFAGFKIRVLACSAREVAGPPLLRRARSLVTRRSR